VTSQQGCLFLAMDVILYGEVNEALKLHRPHSCVCGRYTVVFIAKQTTIIHSKHNTGLF